MPKRFIIVEINGLYYELERPYGCEQFMVMMRWSGDPVTSELLEVWVEPA